MFSDLKSVDYKLYIWKASCLNSHVRASFWPFFKFWVLQGTETKKPLKERFFTVCTVVRSGTFEKSNFSCKTSSFLICLRI